MEDLSPAAARRTPSAKALKVLGATQDEVRFERAHLVFNSNNLDSSADRVFVECNMDMEMVGSPDSKAAKVLGLPGDPPLEWLRRSSTDSLMEKRKRLPTKALQTLGATIDDVRSEAPGREIPAGKLPRPAPPLDEAVVLPAPPALHAAPLYTGGGMSVFLAAFLPWGVLAPLNVLKLQLNKVRSPPSTASPVRARACTCVCRERGAHGRACASHAHLHRARACGRRVRQVSPGAHLWVPAETEQCQAACGVARMWATLFWSMQFANALACLYLHYRRERGLALLSVAHKLVVGATLLKAYLGGVIFWPIGLLGTCCEFGFAFAFARELRK
jgi:hypothetical protein